MNITDVDNIAIPTDSKVKLRMIFDRQLELIHKYHPIEHRNGFHVGDGIPLGLNNKKDQHRLKDMSWRIIEEVAEAFECALSDPSHNREEMIDGLHFLVELMILSGFQASDLEYHPHMGYLDLNDLNFVFRKFTEYLGGAMNCLKNKPWKQTHMLTDKDVYRAKLTAAWEHYMYWLNCIMSEDTIFQIYFKKAAVNSFRQRSNY